MSKPFTIDRVSWHTKTAGNPESRKHITERFTVIAAFLDKSGLLARPLKGSPSDDTFAIESEDLTPAGITFMKTTYDKWLKAVDQGDDPTDVSMLERTLKRLGKG